MSKKEPERNPWLFDGEYINEIDIKKYRAFVYLITSLIDGRKYLGYKSTTKIRKVKGKVKRQRSESNWRDYFGSSDELAKEIEKHGKENFRREILSFHVTEGDAKYTEVKEQFKRNVLENDEYINDNIAGRWYKKPQHIIEGRNYASNNLFKT